MSPLQLDSYCACATATGCSESSGGGSEKFDGRASATVFGIFTLSSDILDIKGE